MNFKKEKYRKFRMRQVFFIAVAVIAGIFIFGSIVMYLWNAILPAVMGVNTITFWQALGILLLSKILFGGIHSRRHRHGCHGRRVQEMKEKWMHLSPEEKEEMRNKLRNHFDASPEKDD